MSVPAYADYKDSGVPWLRAVPSHWEITRFKNLLRERDARSESGCEELLSVSAYTGVTPKSESTGEGEFLSRAESLEGYKICKRNDLVMNIMLAWNRGLGVTKYDGIVSPAYCVFELGSDLHPDFCNYALRADEYTGYFKAHSAGVIDSRLRLYPDKFGALLCAFPPNGEQATIVTFLDRETAKIDALVAEQERLIALLKEKRQAVISHAVTKGLNPDAPMKDSGIEWLGEIPAHWQVVKAIRFFRAFKGKEGQLLTKEYCAENAGEYPVYSGQTENDGVMGTLDRYEFDAGEAGYLFATTVGAKAMTVSHIFGKFSLSQNCMIIRPVDCSTDPRFYYYHFQPVFSYHRSLIPDHMQPSFRMEDLYGFPMALPPKGEQVEIASYLDDKLVGFRALENEAQSAITLLQERRAALISAAVTGKIDVRGLVTHS